MIRSRIRRVLVAVDASEPSAAAAEAAAELAAALAVELAGLFVEDDRLLRLAAHPLASQVDALSAERRELQLEVLERGLRAQAARARHRLASAAGRTGATWTFQVARGAVEAQILSALGPSDLVAVGRVGWSGGRALGATARALLEHGSGDLLILPRSPSPLAAVAVLCDGGAAALTALAAAASLTARLSATRTLPLRVLVPLEVEDPAEVERIAGEALATSGLDGLTVEMRRVARGGLAEALALPGRRHALLVLPAAATGTLDDLLRLVEALDASVLLLR